MNANALAVKKKNSIEIICQKKTARSCSFKSYKMLHYIRQDSFSDPDISIQMKTGATHMFY